MDKIVVIGGGGHAKVVIAVLKKTTWHVIGYTDPRDTGPNLGVPWLGEDGYLAQLIKDEPECAAVVGVGKIDTSSMRLELQAQIAGLGFRFPPIVSPHACVNEEVSLGPNTVVLDGAVVNSGARLGAACIVNTHATVEHDCRLGDNVHIAPGAVVSGGANIGGDCLIGAGAVILQRVKIAPGCLVGAGAVVLRDIEVAGTYVGNPAARIRI
jgi:sugar O-acyltransferase (sialic acid O-acetyltransferase NeuD family)